MLLKSEAPLVLPILKSIDRELTSYWMYNRSAEQINYLMDLRVNLMKHNPTMKDIIHYCDSAFSSKTEARKFINFIMFGIGGL